MVRVFFMITISGLVRIEYRVERTGYPFHQLRIDLPEVLHLGNIDIDDVIDEFRCDGGSFLFRNTGQYLFCLEPDISLFFFQRKRLKMAYQIKPGSEFGSKLGIDLILGEI